MCPCLILLVLSKNPSTESPAKAKFGPKFHGKIGPQVFPCCADGQTSRLAKATENTKVFGYKCRFVAIKTDSVVT